MLFSVRPDRGVAAFPEMIVDLAEAAGAGLAPLALVSLKGAGSRFSGHILYFCLGRLFPNPLVDLCRRGPLHFIRYVGVDIQRGAAGHMADDRGKGLHIHAVLQGGSGEGMPQIVEPKSLAVSSF